MSMTPILRTPAISAGDRFGRLVVISLENVLRPVCRCDCGVEKSVGRQDLRRKDRRACRSCGCRMIEAATEGRTTHGQTGTPTHKSWASMRERCSNPNRDNYVHYGGRGIRVCASWNDPEEGFSRFLSDMGARPSIGHSIDRKNSDRGYACGRCEDCISRGVIECNCRWATRVDQSRNKRNSKLNSQIARNIKGAHSMGMSGADIARMFGLSKYNVSDVVRGKIWVDV